MSPDKDTIGKLWDEITPKLYGYIRHTLRDRVLADDILQTTWLKAIEAMPRFRDQGQGLSPWLFSIARNEMKMHWRKSGREIQYDPDLHDKAVEEPRTEDSMVIEAVLRELSQEDQELVRLRYIGDLPFKEIAKILNLNPIHVRVKMHRILVKARNIFKAKI